MPSPSPYLDQCGAVASSARCVVLDPGQMARIDDLLHLVGFGVGALFGLLVLWAAWRMLNAMLGRRA